MTSTQSDPLARDGTISAMPPESPTSTLTLNKRTAELLRRQIVQGELVPGQRLSEVALSENLGISRNTLREVFRLLTKENLLTHAPNRGVSVAVPGIAAIIDIYRVRRIIECQALAQASPYHPALERLRAAVAMARQCRETSDWRGVGTANMAFHEAIVELADSERLNSLFSQLLAELRLAFGLLNEPEFLHAPYVDRNQQMLELLEAGRQQEASALLKDYLEHSERTVLAAYARNLPDSAANR